MLIFNNLCFLWSLLFQSLRLFRLAGELEAKAASLHLEALQHMTITLAGVNCRELFTLLVTFFGRDTGIDPFSFLDAAPRVPVPLDLTDTESEEEGGGDGSSAAEGSGVASSSLSAPPSVAVTSVGTASSLSTISAVPPSTLVPPSLQAQPSSSTITPAPVPVVSMKSADPQPSISGVSGEPPAKKIRVCPRQTYQDKVADIRLATQCFPTDADLLHNTGISPQYAVRRAGASGRGTSLYDCPYSHLCSTPPYIGDFPSCGSHVRKVHLGVCLACPYCPEQLYYNGSGWHKHMCTEHPSVPWYSSQLHTPSTTPPEVVKQEAVDVPVTPVTEISTTASSSMTLADIMAGPIPTDPLPLPEPISEEPPPPEESLPFVEEETEDLTPEQEEALLQAGDAPSDDPSDDTDETEEDQAINAAWEEMRATRPEMPYEEMKSYLRHTFAPSDLRQFNFAVNREGIMVSHYRKDGFASKKAAFALVQADLQLPGPPPPLEPGEECVRKRTAPQKIKVWPKPLTGLIWKAKEREDFDDPTM